MWQFLAASNDSPGLVNAIGKSINESNSTQQKSIENIYISRLANQAVNLRISWKCSYRTTTTQLLQRELQ